jgi:hypothetical protein
VPNARAPEAAGRVVNGRRYGWIRPRLIA